MNEQRIGKVGRRRDKEEEEITTFKVPHHRNISTISPNLLEAKQAYVKQKGEG